MVTAILPQEWERTEGAQLAKGNSKREINTTVNRIARNRTKNLVRDMFVQGTLRRMEKPMVV